MDKLQAILTVMDEHPGLVTFLGIIVTIVIFLRQLSNSYYTMERDTFSELFKEPVTKELPEKIAGLRNAAGSEEWDSRFGELLAVLEEIGSKAEVYTYSIPFFYKALDIRIREIRNLTRGAGASEWMLFREKTRQNDLITKKCRSLINTVFNVSKGRVFKAKLFTFRPYQAVRRWLRSNLTDHPADRIMQTYEEGSLSRFEFSDEGGASIPAFKSKLKSLPSDSIRLRPKDGTDKIVGLCCIQKDAQLYFGYANGLRWGSTKGRTVLKTAVDPSVRTSFSESSGSIVLGDDEFHKIVVLWSEAADPARVRFASFNVRSEAVSAKK